ncbi:hypothetical protein [Aminobacter sp. HY435]|uniref:hypothetical protein n=1 Tax=Aminobacter sp. HY435 TaxID=2970917 RepID=UPI0022B9B852|nr:hypothetical protein [Aminobacter sp. HY435]
MANYDVIIFTAEKQRPSLNHWVLLLKEWLRGVEHPKYGGHSAVTRSLVDGLNSLPSVKWLYPRNYGNQTAKIFHAVSGHVSVRVGIQAKRQGLCQRLIVGPNIVVRAFEQDSLLASPEIDVVLVPSEWVKCMYEADEPRLRGKIEVWPAGVDVSQWSPSGSLRSKVLIYDKREPELSARIAEVILASGNDYEIIRYGAYSAEQYRSALDRAKVCIVVGGSESQGIALAEAWAMNVPTLVRRVDYNEEVESACSAAPYLSYATGAFWSGEEELLQLLQVSPEQYSPRDWVLANCTDRHAAISLLRIAGLPSKPMN